MVDLKRILQVGRPGSGYGDFIKGKTILVAVYKLTGNGIEFVNGFDLDDEGSVNKIIKEHESLVFFMRTDYVKKYPPQTEEYRTKLIVYNGEIPKWGLFGRDGYSISNLGDIYNDKKEMVSEGEYSLYNSRFKDSYRIGDNGFISPSVEEVLDHLNYLNDRLNNFIAEQKKPNGRI